MFNDPIKSNFYAPKHKRACLTLLDNLCFWPLKLSLKFRKNCKLLQTLLWNVMFNDPLKSNFYAPKHKSACLTLLDNLCFWPLKLSLKFRKNCKLLQTPLWNLILNDPSKKFYICPPPHKNACLTLLDILCFWRLKLVLKFRKNCKLLQALLWNTNFLSPSNQIFKPLFNTKVLAQHGLTTLTLFGL